MSQRIALTLRVTSPVQADELRAAWQEIVSGRKYTHAEALEHGLEAILERGRIALQIIETAIRENPGTGQAGRLVRFLAAIYNGHDFAFDLAELRALDTRLANACLDYLNYDRLSKARCIITCPGEIGNCINGLNATALSQGFNLTITTSSPRGCSLW